jgi:hypothetical protein
METEMGGAYDTHGREETGSGVKISMRKPRGKRSSAITIGRRIIKWTINLTVERELESSGSGSTAMALVNNVTNLRVP